MALRNGGDIGSLAMNFHFAGNLLAIGAAEQRHGKLGAARPHQPGDADNLALAHIQVDTFDHLPVCVQRMVTLQLATSKIGSPILAARGG